MDNKLTRIDHPSATVQQFSYDGDGVRRSAAKDGVVTHFLYDSNGLRVLAELDANGVTTARQSYGEGLVSEWRGGAHRWPLYTALGSTAQLTDASQAVTDSYVLDAYGSPVAQTGQTATPYKYFGRLSYNTDATSGLLLLGARWYEAEVGRFISEDPIRDGGNWFEYAAGEPTASVDPYGESAIRPGDPEWPREEYRHCPLLTPLDACMMFCMPVGPGARCVQRCMEDHHIFPLFRGPCRPGWLRWFQERMGSAFNPDEFRIRVPREFDPRGPGGGWWNDM